MIHVCNNALPITGINKHYRSSWCKRNGKIYDFRSCDDGQYDSWPVRLHLVSNYYPSRSPTIIEAIKKCNP